MITPKVEFSKYSINIIHIVKFIFGTLRKKLRMQVTDKIWQN